MSDYGILLAMVMQAFPQLHPLEVHHVASTHVMWHERNDVGEVDDRVCESQIRHVVTGSYR